MVYIPETDDIYFAKTKEYFNEVLGDYANGNYRSAVVMLYSVTICDLLFKLQELLDMYNDPIAANILEEVEKSRNSSDNKSKSFWEKKFVDNIHEKTELLDMESYTILNHLYDHRNFSAHPALNNNFELISPSKETTIALIKSVLENILIKPPIFAKKIVDMLVEDLSEKKSIYKDELEKLHEYLKRKYFDHMSDSMKKGTFRSLWKLCFCLPGDENCRHNLFINRKAMEFLFDDTAGLIDFMKSNSMFTKTSPNENCVMHLCIFLAHYPQIYTVLSEDTKMQIENLISKSDSVRIISWFLCKNKTEHMQKMIASNNYGKLDEETIKFVSSQYELSGDITVFIDYCIKYFGSSDSFDCANERYSSVIYPFLTKMTREQFINLISEINSNNQIYKRKANYSSNTEIVKVAFTILGHDFNYDSYPNFTFDKDIIGVPINENILEDEYEMELPF